ncbi:MAG: hypothetical protein SGILL_006737 [Bacillariaceae sp.]
MKRQAIFITTVAVTLLLSSLQVLARPNVIIIQPDDLPFFDEFHPPAQRRGAQPRSLHLPNIDRLRADGLEMTRAYTVSPACGTSRYSTITGRYPSRSSYMRRQGSRSVWIPDVKLIDTDAVPDGNDCSSSNVAQLFQANGYKTGMFGKWHLIPHEQPYSYANTQQAVRSCGFDTAEAVYWHNIKPSWTGERFSHNLEYITKTAIDFMEEQLDEEQNFFMYFNPTAPWDGSNFYEALMDYSCKDTPAGRLSEEPIVPGMTEGIGCEPYRRSIVDRAGGRHSATLGSIWVDDAVGALVQFLESKNQLNNTIIAFQSDHGLEGKFSLYEDGIRIMQFVHYPNEIPAGSSYKGLVATIDVAPTMADFAGINATSPGWYDMDGMSWRSLPQGLDRCLIAEFERDLSVVCECDKVLFIPQQNSDASYTYYQGQQDSLVNSSPGWIQLCDAIGNYYTAPYVTPEETPADYAQTRMVDALRCHLASTRPKETPIYGTCDSHLMNLPR